MAAIVGLTDGQSVHVTAKSRHRTGATRINDGGSPRIAFSFFKKRFWYTVLLGSFHGVFDFRFIAAHDESRINHFRAQNVGDTPLLQMRTDVPHRLKFCPA